jgi:CDP-diacylglycerol--glycerol-3-phosphate 3-phosphatidyltransferase
MSASGNPGTGLTPPRIRAKAWATRYFSAPIARTLITLHISPNMITVAGFLVSAVAAYLLAEGYILEGGIVMLVGASMDMFDGAVARISGKESTFGAFLDSVTDRLGEAVVLFGLLVFYVRGGDELGAYLAFGTVVFSYTTSYLRARAEGLGVPGDVGFMGRPERVVVLGVGLLLGYEQYALGIMLAVSALTIAQRIAHVWRNADR